MILAESPPGSLATQGVPGNKEHMIQKDYILRTMAELATVLTGILGFQQAKQYQAALDLIDQVFKQTLGLSLDLINSVPDETLLAMLTSFDTLDIEKCLFVASLLKAEGDIYVDQDNFDTSYYRYLKSLHLFLEVQLSDSNIHDPDLFAQIEGLLATLEEYELPVEIKSRLFRYYERTGRYSRAEDMLLEVLEANFYDHDMVEQGIAFYQRLLKKKDTDLAVGNLSREEVKEGLAQLQTMR